MFLSTRKIALYVFTLCSLFVVFVDVVMLFVFLYRQQRKVTTESELSQFINEVMPNATF